MIFISLAESPAIVVAPTAVFMTADDPSARVTLYNPSETPEEVTVESVFGFPATDAEGNLFLHEADPEDAGADRRSAAEWTRAFPRRLVMPPGERRVVRFLARPPADLEDGEYWARIVFTSRGQRVPVGEAADTGDVRASLDLEVRTVIAAVFRKGEVQTGVRIEELAPRLDGDTLELRPRFVREGEAAYVGRLEVALLDQSGETVREWTEQVAVYREYHRRYRYRVDGLPPGDYRVRLRLTTDRDDVPREHRLPTRPVVATSGVINR